MFIIANSLEFNGGSTFIIRLAREYMRRNKKLGVLILVKKINADLKQQLDQVADVFLLEEYMNALLALSNHHHVSIFLPVNFNKLNDVIIKYGNHIHVMGVFGLLFSSRLIRNTNSKYHVSAGVYHQYEYMFTAKNYLAHHAQQIFKKLNDSIIFFNEETKLSYSTFFGTDYTNATLVPIGIELPEKDRNIGSPTSFRIVSIGNLYPFKTYNLHIIKLMPELLKLNNKFTYEIYGEGDLEKDAHNLISQLYLTENVFLKGRIPYDRFANVLDGAFLFVGSGTAIIEASVLSIPAIIGIESSVEPITYGFLSEIPNLSYNELNNSHATLPISNIIEKITLDINLWHKIAKNCQDKAKQFSITYTADGFEQIESKKNILDINDLSKLHTFKVFLSFLILGIKHFFRLNTDFAQRRNGTK